MPNDNNFDAWLRDALDGRPNVFLVRGSGLKENGRPVIDDSRVSKWLKGEQRPSMELAALAARVLGRPQSEALMAAGYTYGHSLVSIERMEREHPLPPPGDRRVNRQQLNRLRQLHEQLGALIDEIGGDEGEQAPATKAPDLGPAAPAGNLSAVDDALASAAKTGEIEDPGEFND